MKWTLSIESNNLKQAEHQLKIRTLKKSFPHIEFKQDKVAYGLEEVLAVAFVFVYEAAVSGLTWDLIKLNAKLLSNFLAKSKAVKEENLQPVVEVSLKDGDNYITALIKSRSPDDIVNAFGVLELTWKNEMLSKKQSSKKAIYWFYEDGKFKAQK